MPYCVNCGVELADNLGRCPLCETEVPLPCAKPNDNPQYPQHSHREQTIQNNGIAFILSLLFLIPAGICFVCDIGLNRAVTWSAYGMGACGLLYLLLVPPIRFRRLSPVWVLTIDTAGISAYLLLIERASGGKWFLPFGLPVALGLAAIVIVLLFFLLHTKAPRLNIAAGALASVGLYTVWIEFLVNTAFHIHTRFVWSLYPLVTCVLLGAVLVVIEYNKPLKEKLRRKFFL